MDQDVGEDGKGGSRIPLSLSATRRSRITPPPSRSPRSPSAMEWADWVGRRVCVSGAKEGMLRFYGETHFAPGLWCGIELNAPLGKNDGSIDGVAYFHCDPNHGLFAPHSKVEPLGDASPDNTSFEDLSPSRGKKDDNKKSPGSMIPILMSPKRKGSLGDSPGSQAKNKAIRPTLLNGAKDFPQVDPDEDSPIREEIMYPPEKPLIRTRSFVIEKKTDPNVEIPTIDPNQTYTLAPEEHNHRHRVLSTDELAWKDSDTSSVIEEGDTFTFDESLGILSSAQMDDFTLCAADRTLSECFAFPNSESLNDIHELPEHEEVIHHHLGYSGIMNARSMLGLSEEDITLIQDQCLSALECCTINEMSEERTLSLDFEPCHISTPTKNKEFELLKSPKKIDPPEMISNLNEMDLKEMPCKGKMIETSFNLNEQNVVFFEEFTEEAPVLNGKQIEDDVPTFEEVKEEKCQTPIHDDPSFMPDSESFINNNETTMVNDFDDFETTIMASKDSYKSNIEPLMDNIESNLTALEMNLESNLPPGISNSINGKDSESIDQTASQETKLSNTLDNSFDLELKLDDSFPEDHFPNGDIKGDYNVLPTPLLEKKLEHELVSLNKMLEDLEIEVLSAKKKNEAAFMEPKETPIMDSTVETPQVIQEDEDVNTKFAILSDPSSSEPLTIQEVKSEPPLEKKEDIAEDITPTIGEEEQREEEEKKEKSTESNSEILPPPKEETVEVNLESKDSDGSASKEEGGELTLTEISLEKNEIDGSSIATTDQPPNSEKLEEDISEMTSKDDSGKNNLSEAASPKMGSSISDLPREVVLEEVTIELEHEGLRGVYSKRSSQSGAKSKRTEDKSKSPKKEKQKGKNMEEESTSKEEAVKPPKKNVMSKLKAMLEATSLGRSKAGNEAKKPPAAAKKSRWEAMTSKFTSSDNKNQLKKGGSTSTLPPSAKKHETLEKRSNKTLDQKTAANRTAKTSGKTPELPSSRSTSPLAPSEVSSRSKTKGVTASSVDSGSKISKGQPGRKSVSKPFLFSRKSQPKPQAAAAAERTFNTRQELAQEIGRLGALCETRTKELNLLKMRLRHAVLGFDAFSVVVKYMAEELKAFAHPSLADKLLRTELELGKAQKQLESYQREVQFLKEQHAAELAALSLHLEQTHQRALDQLYDAHTGELKTLKAQHRQEVGELAGKFSHTVEGQDSEHTHCMKTLHHQFNKQIEELESQHRRQLEGKQLDYEKQLTSLTQQIGRIRQQSQTLRANLAQMEENFHKDADSKVQWLLSKKCELEKEVDSLKTVLEMKNSELHTLRTENMENKKELEKMELYKEKIKMLEAKTEDLQALVDEKVRVQRELSNEHQQLRDHFEKEAMVNKRLSLENEELAWKLRQTAENTSILSGGESPELLQAGGSPLRSPSGQVFFQYASEQEGSPQSPIRKVPCPSPAHRLPPKKSKMALPSALPVKRGVPPPKRPPASPRNVENGSSPPPPNGHPT